MLYLLHLRFSGESSHYIGYCRAGRLAARMREHARNSSSPYVRKILEAGGSFEVARVWIQGDYAAERALKRDYEARALCPICKDLPKDSNAAAFSTFFLAKPATCAKTHALKAE